MFENFQRLYIAIQYCGHLVLLAELHKHLPKKKKLLYQNLSTTNSKKLSGLYHKRPKIINDDQWKMLYPNTGETDSENFDISLCFILLRNVCPNLAKPGNGWDCPPPIGDRTIEANLARLKLLRNEFSHGATWHWFMSDSTFQKRWSELEVILNDLSYQNLPSRVSIADLKVGPLDAQSTQFQAQQKLCNELFKMEQHKMKALCRGGSIILSILWVLVAILLYQYLTPGSAYRYYRCSMERKQPHVGVRFDFVPVSDPYMVAHVNGIEFTFEELMRKTEHDYVQVGEGYTYFLNIDRCAYAGITTEDLITGRKATRGPEVFAVDWKCTHVSYYNGVPPATWVKYKSVKKNNIFCKK